MDGLRRIVLVDDEPGVLATLLQQIHDAFREQMETVPFPSSRKALEFFESHSAADVPVALTIVDQVMPDLTGDQLLARVRPRFPHMRVMVLTGYPSVEVAMLMMNVGKAQHFLAKPWERAELIQTARTLVREFDLMREREQLLADLQDRNEALASANAALETQNRLLLEQVNEVQAKLLASGVVDGRKRGKNQGIEGG